MRMFLLQLCDHAGHVLSGRQVEARDVYGALAEANRRACALAGSMAEGTKPSLARIDVNDQHGRTVARLLWSEALAAMARH